MSVEAHRLTFEDEGHKYFLDDQELKSVTTLLKEVGEIDDTFYTDAGARVGKRRHKLTQLLDEELVDWGEVLEEDLIYAQGWAEFRDEYKPDIEEVEFMAYHPIYRYAGTVDRLVLIDGTPTIIDIKTGKRQKWHPLQTTFYAMMFQQDDGTLPDALAVYLRPGKRGNYSAQYYPPEDYLKVCMSILTLTAWRAR